MLLSKVPSFMTAALVPLGLLLTVPAEGGPAGDGAPPTPSIEETLAASPLLLEHLRARVERELGDNGDDADLAELERAVAAAERMYLQLDGPAPAIDELRTLRRRVSRARAGATPQGGATRGALVPERRTISPSPAASVAPITLQGADACEDAPLLGFGTFLGTTAGATRDSAASCAPTGVSGDVWYRVRIPGFASALFASTAGSDFDTVLTLHEGCPNAAFQTTLELVCDDNGGPGRASALSWEPFETPAEVYVRIGGALTDAGDYRLTLAEGGVVEGRILSDVDGSPVPNVDLQLRSESTVTVWSATADSAGRYRFDDLPTDTYRLVAFGNNVYLGEVFDDIPCDSFGGCPVNQGTPISVEIGQTV
ncbi:MAG: carboxypeptidase-like regulatory domain-containing protein, partial [Acidobacteriota bacterium]